MIALLAIGGIGFALLVVSWLAGELFDLGHDVAGFFGDHLDGLDVDGHHIELGHHADDMGGAGLSPFSSRVIFTFMTAFGGGGAVASIYGLSTAPSALVGVGSGVVLGSATYGLARILWRQSSSSDVTVSSLIGRTGRVVVGIPQGGIGQVTVLAGGGSSTLLARVRSGGTLNEGAQVRIVEEEPLHEQCRRWDGRNGGVHEAELRDRSGRGSALEGPTGFRDTGLRYRAGRRSRPGGHATTAKADRHPGEIDG